MSTSPRPAQCAEQDNPGANYHFRRTWSPDMVTGPDYPVAPAHGLVWHADAIAARQDAIRRSKPTWQRAERMWERATGVVSRNETGLHQRGDR
jgi:hypothetical protein